MAAEGGGVSTKGGLQGESSHTLPKSTRFSQKPPNTQGSTQTLRGEMAETQHTPSDPEDSDMEEHSEPRGRGKGKQSERLSNRRYTLEPGEVDEEILLTETQDGEEEPNESIFAKVQNATELIASVSTHPEIWSNAIRTMMTSLIAYQETNHEYHGDLLSTRQRSAALSQQLKEKSQQHRAAAENEERLRESRNVYRARSTKLKEDTAELRQEVEDLRAQLRTLDDPNEDPNSDPDDSDRGDDQHPRRRPFPQRRATAPSSDHPSRRGTPSAIATTVNSKSNDRYPDVKDFQGNAEDRETWESWKMHLQSKFMQSWEMFETEVSKILYIRDHCKDVAYNIVKAKANLDNAEHYITADEMIMDLEQQYGDVDKEAKADAELQDPKSFMGAKDPKETFDAFHARFTAMIAPLIMSEREMRPYETNGCPSTQVQDS